MLVQGTSFKCEWILSGEGCLIGIYLTLLIILLFCDSLNALLVDGSDDLVMGDFNICRSQPWYCSTKRRDEADKN